MHVPTDGRAADAGAAHAVCVFVLGKRKEAATKLHHSQLKFIIYTLKFEQFSTRKLAA